MDELIQCLAANREWLFSGAGGLLVVSILGLLFRRRGASSSQKIRSGGKSKNIQAGRDVTISNNPEPGDEEKR